MIKEKQKRFADEYIIDLNATQAAIRAGYSEKTAYSQGQRLLKNVEVKIYIDKLIAKRSAKTAISAENVLNEIGKMAFINLKSLYDENKKLLPISDISDDLAAAIISVSENIVGYEDDSPVVKREVKTNKLKALELLGKHLKLFTEKVEITDKTVRIVRKLFDGTKSTTDK